MSGKDIRQRI